MIGRVENCSGSGKGFIRRPAIASETVDSLEGRRNNRQINPRVFHGLTMKSPSSPPPPPIHPSFGRCVQGQINPTVFLFVFFSIRVSFFGRRSPFLVSFIWFDFIYFYLFFTVDWTARLALIGRQKRKEVTGVYFVVVSYQFYAYTEER